MEILTTIHYIYYSQFLSEIYLSARSFFASGIWILSGGLLGLWVLVFLYYRIEELATGNFDL